MKRVVIAVAAVLLLMFAVSAFAIDNSQPSQGTVPNFDQMKADYLKKFDERINSLQEKKACVQAANTQEDLKLCFEQNKVNMKEQRDERGGGRGRNSSKDLLPVK